ncbi:ubiquitin carboxyl-terminal hydrolase 48-like [Saccoglossus kowalevskii]|uniref:Ubiquitin carboxyl-terminal hydrolase 48-like n=1 Tax=Saccoglossus kowalevskii TaxID=10224 RepID=A0ABM0M7B8_SACKO|nr:PREDICTED: ubiquitin carboxyl-terminal hydrolase 48-like [Saccoglossus kowalevskii]
MDQSTSIPQTTRFDVAVVPNGGPVTPEALPIPENLQELVIKDNERFEDWIEEMLSMREQNVLWGKAKHDEIRHLYTMLTPKEGEPWEWITVDWLRKWLSDENTSCPPVDNQKLLCKHGNMDPDKVNDAKHISKQAADLIFTKYHGAPRILQRQFCKQCVVDRCKLLRIRLRITEDHKILSNLTKHKVESGFWIGKASLRGWRGMVLNKLEGNTTNRRKEDEDDSQCTQSTNDTSKELSSSQQSKTTG